MVQGLVSLTSVDEKWVPFLRGTCERSVKQCAYSLPMLDGRADFGLVFGIGLITPRVGGG